MILVTVSYHAAEKIYTQFLDDVEIGNEKIIFHKVVVSRKTHTAVDHYRVVSCLDKHTVFSDFLQSAERQNLDLFEHFFLRIKKTACL